MKMGFFFVILAAVVAAALISGCKAQTEQQKPQEQHDLFNEKPKSTAVDWAQSQQRLGGQSKNVTECASDSDCGVGGCSGQVCTTAKEAEGLITTCEYREEYGCLKLTSCGCVDGKCGWRNNSGYKECLSAAKLQQQQ